MFKVALMAKNKTGIMNYAEVQGASKELMRSYIS